MSSSKKILIYLFWFGVVAVTAALSVYAYLGIFTRYMADDYCLLVALKSNNILVSSWNKYLFSSNRFSNLFVLGFWELFPKNIEFVPALHIILWVVGLYWLFTELDKLFDLKLELPVRLFAVEGLVLFSFFMAPNVFQVLYWRPGQVTYLTPLVFFSVVAAWLTRIVRLQKVSVLMAILFAFLAFFIGGLSETLGAMHMAVLAFAIVGVFIFDKSPRRKPALTLLIALLIGALLALLAMLFAPANSIRINPEIAVPTPLEVLARALHYTWTFLQISVHTIPTPLTVLTSLSVLLSYLFFVEREKAKLNPRFAWVFLLIPILTYGLIFASFAPSAYGQSYPVERVRFPAHFISSFAVTSFGICLGYVLSYVKVPALARYAVAAVAFVALFYPFWMIRQPLGTYEFRRLFALRWDERETMIYHFKEQGELDVVIPALDGYEGTKELDIRPFFWVNQCAAQIYGVHTISAISVEEEDVLNFFSQ